ncbi:hypothetical protein B5C34_11650 [Pacificimonas flava]|uniref:Uncharacterized protein n=2 Tax=Pacificimonas TaxID=1960290 RepID=A0A219B8C4_9SPHN|nr:MULTISPECIES: hypothetical protein [Pacificimonas]MBZ6378681.1 hypothetical protein [Pacificimonas aurantium]OWV34049.1 hypothetical protein B5C34_11650 [Pacificimonas flava]
MTERNADSEPRNGWPEAAAAGFALFLATFYIISLNPAILSEAGVPYGFAFFGTLVIIILANLTSAVWTGTGLIIAPAVGLSVFFADFIQKSDALGWQGGYRALFVAGLMLVGTTFFLDWRERIVERALPTSIKAAAVASIGALLIQQAVDTLGPLVDVSVWVLAYAAFGVALIGLFTYGRYRLKRGKDFLWMRAGTRRRLAERLFLHSEYLIAVIAGLLLAWLTPDSLAAAAVPAPPLTWPASDIREMFTFADVSSNDSIFVGAVFAVIVWFVVITDIPGTPSFVLPSRLYGIDRTRAVKNGYRNDALAAMFSPAVGTTPTIYYAENLILQDFGEYGRRPALVMVAFYTLVLLILLAAPALGWGEISPERLLPPFVVSTILLSLGIMIVAKGFTFPPPTARAAATQDRTDTEEPVSLGMMPAAIAVTFTPLVGLEFAFPLAIVSSFAFDNDVEDRAALNWIRGGALLLIGLLLLFAYG